VIALAIAASAVAPPALAGPATAAPVVAAPIVATPAVGLAALADLDAQGDPARTGMALLGRGELSFGRGATAVAIEASLGSTFDRTLLAGTMGGVRWRFTPRADGTAEASLTAAGGVRWGPAPEPIVQVGLAVDLPTRRRWTGRLGAGFRAGTAGLATALEAGLRWRAPVRPPAPAAPPPDPKVTVDASDAKVWIPHPICEWVPPSEAGPLLAAVPDATVEVTAPGHLPAAVPVTPDMAVHLPPAPPQGGLVVVATPGDVVRIAGAELRTGPDGTVVLNVAEGPIALTVDTLGTPATLEGAVASGFTVWLRAPAPAAIRVPFAADSTLDPAWAERTKNLPLPRYAWIVHADGAAHAAAVVALLRAAGVPEDGISVDPSASPDTVLEVRGAALPEARP
jgi:hypothetical protein